jgi:hypothetical protein
MQGKKSINVKDILPLHNFNKTIQFVETDMIHNLGRSSIMR